MQDSQASRAVGTTSSDSLESDVRRSLEVDTQGKAADLGPWTLDLGLHVSDLRKSFTSPTGQRIDVIQSVSFSASLGESLAIQGASGAGKSTLLHLLGGVETTDHGNIAFGHFAVEQAGAAALARFRNRQVGFVFQFHHLLSDLTAAENVCMPLMIGGMSRRKAMADAERALEGLGLGDRATHPIGSLSGGEQQRAAVCRALIAQPQIVLADEPTGNLDEAIGDQIAQDLVSYAKSRPAVVIIATHSPDLAHRCDRTLILRNGRVSVP
jgi:lipoprotein-releasing system ATP-binding protein